MYRYRHRLLLHLPLLLLPLGSCDAIFGPEEPTSVPESELTFVRLAPDAPPLLETKVTFWAVRGQTREVMIRYASNGGYNGKCLLLRVPAGAVPAGSAPGDSVQITIEVPDADLFRFRFSPAGLRFDPAFPAELEVRYRYADPDYNGDGVVDAADQRYAETFAFWKQERPGEEWQRIPTVRRQDIFEAFATVTGFTQYALATDFSRPNVER